MLYFMLYILLFSSQNTSFAVQLKKKKSSKCLQLPVLWGTHSLPLQWTWSTDASFIQHTLQTCWRACAGSFVSILKVVIQVSHRYNTNKPPGPEQSLERKKTLCLFVERRFVRLADLRSCESISWMGCLWCWYNRWENQWCVCECVCVWLLTAVVVVEWGFIHSNHSFSLHIYLPVSLPHSHAHLLYCFQTF